MIRDLIRRAKNVDLMACVIGGVFIAVFTLMFGIVGNADVEQAQLQEHFNNGGSIEQWHDMQDIEKGEELP